MRTLNRTNANRLRFLASLVVGLCLAVGTVLEAGVSQKEVKKEAKPDQKNKSDSGEKTVITGSLIPQQVKPDRIPVTASPVIIIGRQDIERSGAVTVLAVLKKHGTGR
jgi:outer membrane cobalamin receptor